MTFKVSMLTCLLAVLLVPSLSALTQIEPPADHRLAELTQEALTLDSTSNPLNLAADIERMRRIGSGNLYSVSLALSVPIDKLNLTDDGDALVGQLKLAIAAPDTEVAEVSIALRIAKDQTGTHYTYALPLVLPAGGSLAIGLLDETSATSSFLTFSFNESRSVQDVLRDSPFYASQLYPPNH